MPEPPYGIYYYYYYYYLLTAIGLMPGGSVYKGYTVNKEHSTPCRGMAGQLKKMATERHVLIFFWPMSILTQLKKFCFTNSCLIFLSF
jgi:hypothetical protein